MAGETDDFFIRPHFYYHSGLETNIIDSVNASDCSFIQARE